MKYLNKFIKGLSEDVQIKKRTCSCSTYYTFQNNFTIRLSDHYSPIYTNNIDLSIVKPYNADEFILTYKDSRVPLIFNRRKTNDYIRFCLLNETLLNNAKIAHKESKKYKKEKLTVEDKNNNLIIKKEDNIDHEFNEELKSKLSGAEYNYLCHISNINFSSIHKADLIKKFKKIELFHKMTNKSFDYIVAFTKFKEVNVYCLFNELALMSNKELKNDSDIYSHLINCIYHYVFNIEYGEKPTVDEYINYINDKYGNSLSNEYKDIKTILWSLITFKPFSENIRKKIYEIIKTHKILCEDVIRMYFDLTYEQKTDDEFMMNYLNEWDNEILK